MSVSSVNAGNSVGTTQFQNRGQGPGAAFRQLVQAIKSGNLDAAQSAYDSLTSQLPASSQSSSATTSSTQTSFQQFLQQVGSDLQNGDIQGAQQALSSLEQTAQTGKVGGHHHHHGGGGGAQIQASTTATSADATSSGSTTSSILSGVNLTV
ncbi:MAG TPA: hypothetical protein VN229_10105 [Terriglobales bacterium]|nr:hypothetical protein [Terriglobales bacterium]